MAHELDTNEATGALAMFSVGETPWHHEGKVLVEAPTLEEAAVLAGWDYEVVTRPVYAAMEEGGTLAVLPDAKAICRVDRGTTVGKHFCTLGADYEPVQNMDAFGVLEPLLDKGVAHLETGGTLQGGRRAWGLIRFDVSDPVVQEVFAGEVVPYGIILNVHDGSGMVRLLETAVRVVCWNTLQMALGHFTSQSERGLAVEVAHRAGATVKVVEAAEQMFGKLVERYQTMAQQYRVLKQTRLDMDAFRSLVLDKASPFPKALHTPEGGHLTIRGYDMAYNVAERRRLAITEAWTEGKGHLGDLSAWEAYNGAVEVIDHDSALFRSNGSRVASLLGGRLFERKTKVLEALVQYAGAETSRGLDA